MTQEQFETACGKTLVLLRQLIGTEPCAARRDTEHPTEPHHLIWMLVQAALFHFEAKPEKAHRWLGFVQGVLSAKGVQLDDLKRANMPEGEAFDPEKV